jgi:hypothetical protein
MDSTSDTPIERHPWGKKTQASLERAKPDLYDGLIRPGLNSLNLRVSKEAFPEAWLFGIESSSRLGSVDSR